MKQTVLIGKLMENLFSTCITNKNLELSQNSARMKNEVWVQCQKSYLDPKLIQNIGCWVHTNYMNINNKFTVILKCINCIDLLHH